MPERGRSGGSSLGAALEAEAGAGATAALCLLALAGSTWLAQPAPAGTTGVAGTLTATVAEVLRWGLVVGLALRGLGGLVQAGLTHPCGRFPGEGYSALGAGTIWVAGAALTAGSRTPEAALWAAFLLAVLALGMCGISAPLLWWMTDHHRERLAARLAAAREPVLPRAGPTSVGGCRAGTQRGAPRITRTGQQPIPESPAPRARRS